MREDVPLEELLLTVERELLGADGAHLPVALDVLLEAALLKVWREDHLAQRAALVNVTTAEGDEGKMDGVGGWWINERDKKLKKKCEFPCGSL